MLCDCFEKGEKNDYCRGTREKDWCNCGGDESKCDFYNHARDKAKRSGQLTLETAIEHINRLNNENIILFKENERLKEKLREFIEKLREICEEGKDG